MMTSSSRLKPGHSPVAETDTPSMAVMLYAVAPQMMIVVDFYSLYFRA
jgi:hypothetical protein